MTRRFALPLPGGSSFLFHLRSAVALSGVLALLLCSVCCPAAAGSEQGLLRNPDFRFELDGWVFRPGDRSQVTLVDREASGDKALRLTPNGKLLGVETERLVMGRQLAPDQAYQVHADLKNDGLESGVFAFSMYCFDARGRALKQIAFYGLSARSSDHGWRTVGATFGPGTRNPLPAGTHSICIRFSFYEKEGNCRGCVLVDHVILQPYKPAPHESWPRQIVARVGDLEVRFESRSFWTLYRIDYRGTRLGLDRWGSHYGSVASFPGVGFIGSGHTENGEQEQILDLKLFVNGQPLEEPQPEVNCQSIRLHKRSRIRHLVLTTDLTVRGGRIFEEVRLRADEPQRVNLIYHFMHPWTPTATEYCAELLDGTRIVGQFTGDRGQKIDQPARWTAIYDAPSGKGAITYTLDAPSENTWRIRYWDVPERYRKYYFVTFPSQTVPAGCEFRYRIVTIPFEAEPPQWLQEATRLAKAARTAPGD